MCPNCRAFITNSDKVCPYCGVKVGPRSVDVRQPGQIMGGLIPQAHFTTILILLINFGFFIATELYARGLGENVALVAFGAKWGPEIYQEHQWWRLVTAGFLHGGWLHIGMNSWVLYDLGAQVEQVYATPRFLVVYFVGTVAGFYLSLLFNPAIPSIGASAGLTGLIGAMIAFGVANRHSMMGRAIRDSYVRWVVYILAIGFMPGLGVDNWAHIGGLAGGFAVGYVAGIPMPSMREREAMWRVLAAACVLITAFCFLMVYTHFPTQDQLR
ncbi:MAG TPA: rhomboid family intramembrane serine protease [Bryobacteraceae bacterium]|nr:rhomboid family intramembrane serine protease [Bryobacteraceae bacterium]